MHKSNNHILPSRLVSTPRSWAAAACQHSLISKPTQSHFFGSTHWRTWHRERDTAVLLIASCWPSSILCRVSTASLQCIFHYFPSSFTTCHSKRADACLPPSCSCSSMSPCSRHHSSSRVVPHPLWQSPSTARTAALHGTKSTEPLESLILKASSLWEVWPQPQHRVFGAELEGKHSYFKSKCSVTAQWHFILSSSKDTGQTTSFGLTLWLLWWHCYASDPSKAEAQLDHAGSIQLWY